MVYGIVNNYIAYELLLNRVIKKKQQGFVSSKFGVKCRSEMNPKFRQGEISFWTPKEKKIFKEVIFKVYKDSDVSSRIQ